MQKLVLVSVPDPVVSTVPPKVAWSFKLYLYLELTVPQVSDCCPFVQLVLPYRLFHLSKLDKSIFVQVVSGVLFHYYTPGIYAGGYIVFVFPFVSSSVRMFVSSFIRDSVPFVELLQSFMLKFPGGVYLTNHSSESIPIWTIGTPEGRLSFCDS